MANMLATLSIVLAVIQLSQQQQLDEGKWTQPEESWTWRTFNGCRYWYTVYRIRATFEEAEAHCSSKGAHLASIHSEEENILLMTITTTLSDVDDWAENTWIGLRQKDYPNSKEWTWTDGSPVDYVRWANMQPDNGSEKEHCVQLLNEYPGENIRFRSRYNISYWNDNECDRKMKQYVCKTKVC